jgi:glycosyltransferase involved in cell wall biosynthesis
MGSKKILYFISSLCSGGRERRLIELLHYLKKNTDYDMHLLLAEDEIHYDYVKDLEIPITIMKRHLLKKDPTLLLRFYLFARRLKPDLIHAWSPMTAFYAIPASLLLGVPLVNNQIADATPCKPDLSFENILWRINYHFSSRIVANSQAGLNVYGAETDKGHLIYNGVRMERFQGLPDPEKVKERYGIQTPHSVIMVASFTEKKDQRAFVETARKVCSLRSDVTFMAVGDGPTRQKLMRELQDHGPGNFIFTGKITGVEALVNACDIGVLLTNSMVHGEGVPNTVIEYMALGKPVIATDTGGTKELIKDGKTGFLVSCQNNVEEITKKIMLLLDDKELRKSMGILGHQTVCDNFSIDKMGKAFLNLYNDHYRSRLNEQFET